MSKYYTGIGSRQTPADVLSLIGEIAERLSELDWTLRSGGAPGADTAFLDGAPNGGKVNWEVFLPWDGFNDHNVDPATGFFDPLKARDSLVAKAVRIAKQVHPAWDKCSRAAKMLHTRNVFQVGGQDLQTPSRFVICWTSRGQLVGGTATAIRIAQLNNIPVFNLGLKKDRARLEAWLSQHPSPSVPAQEGQDAAA